MEVIWKDIQGFEGIYEISNNGMVRSIPRNGTVCQPKIIKDRYGVNGYRIITLSKNNKQSTHKIHRLVAKNFVENPHLYNEVDHIDGVRDNNIFTNLRWCNRRQNMISSRKMFKNKKSKYVGVSFVESRNRWVSYIKINSKSKTIGWFKTEEEAHIAYIAELTKIDPTCL